MPDPRVLDCLSLATLLGEHGGLFLAHRPERQMVTDPGPCYCVDSYWAEENVDDPAKCLHVVRLTLDRHPDLVLKVCCTCWDLWPGDAEALFDAVSDALGEEEAA